MFGSSDPVNPDEDLKWGHKKGDGKECYYCRRIHRQDDEYADLTVKEFAEHVQEEDHAPEFNRKRERLIELITEKGQGYVFSAADFEVKEKVEVQKSGGEEIGRKGKLYRVPVFDRTFDKQQKKRLKYQKEQIEDPETGELIDAVRVFHDEEGVWDFKMYHDNKVQHKKEVHNGEIKLDKDELTNNFRALMRQTVNSKGHAKDLTAADLQPKKRALSGDPRESAPKALKRTDSNESSSSSGTSSTNSQDAAPRDEATQKVGKKRKGKKGDEPTSKKAKAFDLEAEEEEEAAKDVPQNKPDATFLQQCVVKLNAARQIYDHIKSLKSAKDYDDPRVTQNIRALDGRMDKISRCKFTNTRRQYTVVLRALRAVQELTKAVGKFEKSSKVRKQAKANRAGMITAFSKFNGEAPMVELPWCYDKHKLYLECDMSLEDPFAPLARSQERIMADFKITQDDWTEFVAIWSSDFIEIIILDKASESGWTTEMLMEHIYNTSGVVATCCELTGPLEWLTKMRSLMNPTVSTVAEMKDSLEWLQNKNGIRGVLALFNSAAGEEIVKKVTAIIQADAQDTAIIGAMNKTLEDVQVTAVHAKGFFDGEMFGATNDGDNNMNDFASDFATLEKHVETCNSVYHAASPKNKASISPIIFKVNNAIIDMLSEGCKKLSLATLKVHRSIQDEKEFKTIVDKPEQDKPASPTTLAELADLNDAGWVKNVSKLFEVFATMRQNIIEQKFSDDILMLFAVTQAADSFADGMMARHLALKASDVVEQVKGNMRSLACFKKAIESISDMTRESAAVGSHADLKAIKDSTDRQLQAVQDSLDKFDTTTMPSCEAKSVISLVKPTDAASSSSGVTALPFWPEEFSQSTFWDEALALGASSVEEEFQTAISLAAIKGKDADVARLQILLHTDVAQRGLLKFHKLKSHLQAVSSIEVKNVAFDRDAAKALIDASTATNTLKSFITPLDPKIKEILEPTMKLKDLLSSANSEVDKSVKALTDRWSSIAKMITMEVGKMHPPTKQWKKFVISEPDKDKMIAMTKDENIKGIGGMLPKVKKFTKELEDFCGQTMCSGIRNWWMKSDYPIDPSKDKQGCLGDMHDAVLAAKLALAVAATVKTVYVKGPKAKETPLLDAACFFNCPELLELVSPIIDD